MKITPKSLISLSAFSGLIGLLVGGSLWVQAAARSQIVVFDANWCASCREVVPIIQEVASQNGVAVREIDVDSPNAPEQAKSYGLSIPTRQLPQAYLVKNGNVTLLLDGHQFRSGQSDAIRATVLQNLQQGL